MVKTKPVNSKNEAADPASLAAAMVVTDYRDGCPSPGVKATICGVQVCRYEGDRVPNVEYYPTVKNGCEKSGRTPHWTQCRNCDCLRTGDNFDTNGIFTCVPTTSQHDLVVAGKTTLVGELDSVPGTDSVLIHHYNLTAAEDHGEKDDEVHWFNRIPGLIPIAIFLYVFALCYGIGFFIRDNRKLFMRKTRQIFFGLGFVFFPFMFVLPGLAPPDQAQQYF